ncbi:major facilitator superfamily domain-containing protein 12-like [Babylonia areolata]|uniref:major facilitator superfamily domain-containing protein 12-like n=1 Tax=Babylonia areolata TaxID=304850 RepID=UPI003FD64D62
MPSRRIPLRIRLAYSVGHFQNDLMASMWFSYLLVYLHQVRDFNNIYAGTLLLVGQVADAIATPLIGYEADATSGCCGYTKRKSWHAFGLLCTTCSFPFIFAPVIGADENTSDLALFVYYAAFVIIFQIGWASVQISHLSLIPELTSDKSEVAGLNGWRYAATGVANLMTYAIAWVILSSGSGNVNSDSLGAGDADHFRNLGFTVTGIGLVASVIFHLGVPEPKRHSQEEQQQEHQQQQQPPPRESSYGSISQQDVESSECSLEKSTILGPCRRRGVCEWFCDIRFYQVALIYMCTRLYVNISQVYLPMYLTESIKLDKVTIANVPLVCYASSFLTSTVLKVVDRQLGRELTYVVGLVVAGGASAFVFFIPAEEKWMVYTAAVLIGMGGALMLITSLSFVADLIGEFTGSSAFVYGSMSFTDKLANGVAVEIVQIFHPCVKCCPACNPYYRKVQSFVPGGSAALAFIGLLTFIVSSRGARAKMLEININDPDQDSAAPQTNGQVVSDPRITTNGEVTAVQSGNGTVVGDPSYGD